jgi:NAD(P)-dependent dehydrogenase (short-subunit alcohol dehydrogenase family)
MKIDLKGRIALVTGSTGGIGRAIAEMLARAGAEVIVNGLEAARVDAVADQLGTRGIAADVGTSAGAQQIFDRVPRVDILVNNVGVFKAEPAFDIDDDGWRGMFEINVLSGIRLTRHYAPAMAERGHGRVVFISSEAGVQPPTNMVHYGMTKTAQLAVSRGFAQALAGTSHGQLRSRGPDDERRRPRDVGCHLSRTQPRRTGEAVHRGGAGAGSLLGRVIRPEEIAHLVTYLASDFASATTGRALGVDGGLVPTIIP